jgi:hypothetical protein
MQDPHFRIYPTGADWSWEVRGPQGSVMASGRAESRAHAAACVIHATVRATAPAARAPSARILAA